MTCEHCGAPNAPNVVACAWCLQRLEPEPSAALIFPGVLTPNELRALEREWSRLPQVRGPLMLNPVPQPAPTWR